MEFPMGDPYFDSIRKGDFYYVDKTKYLRTLIKEGKYYFLSRPRRFGKSLLLSTLHNLFEGEKELFKGLYIYDHWEWSQKYFVINISFGGKCRTPEFIEETITTQLQAAANQAGLKTSNYKGLAPSNFLYSLLADWHLKTGQEAVLLIDEYDKPILDVLDDKKAAAANEECLRDFYSIIEDCRNLRFVFVTGITMFSGLNNLKDISFRPKYGAICGYTDKEIEEVFAKEMTGLDRDKIRHWYNGYNWLGEKVYNPLSVMGYFKTKKFKGWWYQSSVPKYLYSFIKDKQVSIKDVVHGVIDEDQFSIFDPEDLKIEALLFQSGYLTIDQKMEERYGIVYRLKYPNFEVQKYLAQGLLAHITAKKITAENSQEMVDLLVENNFESFVEILEARLAGIPYQWHKQDLNEVN